MLEELKLFLYNVHQNIIRLTFSFTFTIIFIIYIL